MNDLNTTTYYVLIEDGMNSHIEKVELNENQIREMKDLTESIRKKYKVSYYPENTYVYCGKEHFKYFTDAKNQLIKDLKAVKDHYQDAINEARSLTKDQV